MSKIEIFKIHKQIETRQAIASKNGSILFNLIKDKKYNPLEKLHEKLDVNFQRKSDGFTPLLVAVSYNHLNMVELLLEKGANASIKSKTGYTPLDLALKINRLDPLITYHLITGSTKYLFALINTQNYDKVHAYCLQHSSILTTTFEGKTPLDYAKFKKDQFMIDILLAHGAKVNIQTPKTKGNYHLSSETIVTQSIHLVSKEFKAGLSDKVSKQVELVYQQKDAIISVKSSSFENQEDYKKIMGANSIEELLEAIQ